MIIFMNHVLAAGRSLKAEILYTTVKVYFKQVLVHPQGLDCHRCQMQLKQFQKNFRQSICQKPQPALLGFNLDNYINFIRFIFRRSDD